MCLLDPILGLPPAFLPFKRRVEIDLCSLFRAISSQGYLRVGENKIDEIRL